MKTRDIIEHLEKYEELIDSVDFLSIDIENLTREKITIHCSRFAQATKDFFSDNADDVVIKKWDSTINVSLNVEGVEYFILVDDEEEARSILKGEE